MMSLKQTHLPKTSGCAVNNLRRLFRFFLRLLAYTARWEASKIRDESLYAEQRDVDEEIKEWLNTLREDRDEKNDAEEPENV